MSYDSNSSTTISAKISSGKAYVKGFEVDRISQPQPCSMSVNKALTTRFR